jgi:endo-1,4-beta-D-glucanase Y
MFFQIRRQYQSLVDRGARWWKWYEETKSDDNPAPNDDEWFAFTCDLLAVNYRLGPEEVSALSLIDLGMEVIHAALGIPILLKEVEERQKKEAQEKETGIAPNG